MDYTIREPEQSDAAMLIEHKEIITEEYPDTLATPMEDKILTIAEQEELIENYPPEDLKLVVEVDDRIVGMLNLFQLNRKKFEHVCQFGISLQSKYAGHGIGSDLVDRALEHAEQSEILEKIILSVFSNNEGAIRFYERLGFVEEGRQKRQVKLKEGYTDLIQMGRFVD